MGVWGNEEKGILLESETCEPWGVSPGVMSESLAFATPGANAPGLAAALRAQNLAQGQRFLKQLKKSCPTSTSRRRSSPQRDLPTLSGDHHGPLRALPASLFHAAPSQKLPPPPGSP